MHILLLSEGPPEQHEKFRKWANKQKYYLKDEPRKGYCKPHVSEVKLWDVRIKEGVSDRFLRDAGVHTEAKGNVKSHIGKLTDWFLKILSTFTPLKRKKVKKSTSKIPGWYYTRVIGVLDDPVKEGIELL